MDRKRAEELAAELELELTQSINRCKKIIAQVLLAEEGCESPFHIEIEKNDRSRLLGQDRIAYLNTKLKNIRK